MCWIGIWICAFGNWFEMLLLGTFHDGFDLGKHIFVMVWTYFRGGVFSWNTIFPMSYWNLFHDGELSQNTILSWNPFVKVNSHEIHSWRCTLTKYQTLMKSIRDGDLSRNTQKNRHENTDANLAITLFSWEWPSRWTLMKIIHGGKLSRKCVFRESISVRGDAWRCTLTHYFRESKTVFRDCFSLSRNIRILVVVLRFSHVVSCRPFGSDMSLQPLSSCLVWDYWRWVGPNPIFLGWLEPISCLVKG
jgi:hypothetical protein